MGEEEEACLAGAGRRQAGSPVKTWPLLFRTGVYTSESHFITNSTMEERIALYAILWSLNSVCYDIGPESCML